MAEPAPVIVLVSGSGTLLQASAIAWAAAFAAYLWRFAPWLVRPRPDRPLPAPAAKT